MKYWRYNARLGAPFGKDVEGWLTAKDVIDRIRPFYNGDCNDNV